MTVGQRARECCEGEHDCRQKRRACIAAHRERRRAAPAEETDGQAGQRQQGDHDEQQRPELMARRGAFGQGHVFGAEGVPAS